METLKKGYRWLVDSSADPKKLSLTIKGAVPFALAFATWFQLGLSEADVNGVADALVAVSVGATTLGTGLIALVGFGRKVWITLKK